MQVISKGKALDRILLGLAVQFIPSFLVGTFVTDLNKLPSLWSLILSFSALGFFVGGYVFFIKGCRHYVQSKGYSSKWGWLGLLSLLGLSILLLIPHRKSTIPLSSSDRPFDEFNIPELLLSFSLALPVICCLILLAFSLLNNLSFYELIENNSISLIIGIVSFCGLIAILAKSFQKNRPVFDQIINYQKNIDFKLILFVAILDYAFSDGFNSILLYKLSFIFPSYVEYELNEKYFNNIPEIFLFSILAILLAPVLEELLFRGIILQKWSTKWGVRAGVIASSLLFAILHLNTGIISIFIGGIGFSVLYLKTRNLLTPVLCHSFYNTTVIIFYLVYFFSNSATEREAFISVSDYQSYIQPLISQKVFLIAITAPLLSSFIYKNFPKDDAILPYYDSKN